MLNWKTTISYKLLALMHSMFI